MNLLDSHSGAPTPTPGKASATAPESFPGFGEGAPLDLPSLTPAATAGILSRLIDGTSDAFADALASAGNCTSPIRLTGHSLTLDRTTGEVISSYSSATAPLGEVLIPCGNRRAHICPACSRVYARDTFELIRAGVAGGKTIPATVAGSPLLFVTFTAPSFGYVHGTRPGGGKCRPRSSDRVQICPHGVRLACNVAHDEEDPRVGSPLCSDCYDWTTAVVWQWHAPELWRRTTIAIRRRLAHALGLAPSRLRDVASLQFAKVAEYQARGAVHFRALIRLDGPDGPGSRAPLDGEHLAQVVRDAAASVTCPAPPAATWDVPRTLAWGRQLDVRTVTNGPSHLRTSDELSAGQVAGYLAKYATKDATDLRTHAPRPHLARLAEHARHLGMLAHVRDARRHLRKTPPAGALDPKTNRDTYALLGKWAHMLGFRGHFATKSRHYSVTLGRLRRARQRFQRLTAQAQREGRPLDTRDLEARLLADDDNETTLVIGSWTYAGTGWPRPGEATLATAAAARAREYDQWRAEHRRHHDWRSTTTPSDERNCHGPAACTAA
ncbi:replication initiator [Arsenicicoccus bolidensis]|uniref:Replication initiation protein n=1 Tax=Arsenicicoccus bolidensis TaxID=229480 RepID=A0ABS9Q185_9MICO|nr:replication initiator [Arsenicicoccus bolidensis]MCG7321619.1 replication initiation protein [Arsenicicoccus bolidensis]